MLNNTVVYELIQSGARVVNLQTGELVEAPKGPRSPDRGIVGEGSSARGLGGLSYAHIGTKHGNTHTVEVYKGGSLIKASKPKEERQQVGGGRRGTISEFSRGARRRMLQMMAKTEREKHPYMVTLTYPADYPGSPSEWKRHLHLFLKRLKYRFGCGGVWKLEPQRRGAPHYHLLVWASWVNKYELQEWVSQNWYEVVGSGDEKHLRAGTRVETIRSYKGVMAYAGKYIGKETSTFGLSDDLRAAWGRAGRWWGVFGRDAIPWADVVKQFVTPSQYYRLVRLMRRAGKMRSRQYQSLMLFCLADFWMSRLDRLLE